MGNITGRILYERTLPSGVTIRTTGTKTLDSNTRIAKNYVLSELANNAAKESIKWILNNDVDRHIQMMQALRDALSRSVKVTSWYRTESFNASCGGSSNSLHLRALATDCWFSERDKNDRWIPVPDSLHREIEAKWRKVCNDFHVIGGINRYTHGVHVSSREDLLGYKNFVVRDYRGKRGDW